MTMARVNRLFGVTMPEKGVSQLVSVDLEKAVQIRKMNNKNDKIIKLKEKIEKY